VRLLELVAGELDPVLDLPRRLGGPVAESPLELLDGRRDEERD